jgi:magnesium-transporting ATPase (P-type)
MRHVAGHKPDNTINLLKQRLADRAHVLRDGKWTELAAVPGDVVRIRVKVNEFIGVFLKSGASCRLG